MISTDLGITECLCYYQLFFYQLYAAVFFVIMWWSWVMLLLVSQLQDSWFDFALSLYVSLGEVSVFSVLIWNYSVFAGFCLPVINMAVVNWVKLPCDGQDAFPPHSQCSWDVGICKIGQNRQMFLKNIYRELREIYPQRLPRLLLMLHVYVNGLLTFYLGRR